MKRRVPAKPVTQTSSTADPGHVSRRDSATFPPCDGVGECACMGRALELTARHLQSGKAARHHPPLSALKAQPAQTYPCQAEARVDESGVRRGGCRAAAEQVASVAMPSHGPHDLLDLRWGGREGSSQFRGISRCPESPCRCASACRQLLAVPPLAKHAPARRPLTILDLLTPHQQYSQAPTAAGRGMPASVLGRGTPGGSSVACVTRIAPSRRSSASWVAVRQGRAPRSCLRPTATVGYAVTSRRRMLPSRKPNTLTPDRAQHSSVAAAALRGWVVGRLFGAL